MPKEKKKKYGFRFGSCLSFVLSLAQKMMAIKKNDQRTTKKIKGRKRKSVPVAVHTHIHTKFMYVSGSAYFTA